MKTMLRILASALVLACAARASADVTLTNSLDELISAKNAALTGNPVVGGSLGGDDIGTATAIGGLPYSDGGNTCTFLNDYDEICPFAGSTSPDVVYSYAPTADEKITIELCDSGYDTKVYVYKNAVGLLVACNDDYCSDPSGNPFRSYIECFSISAGDTYYIVVDGYSGDCGDYTLNVTNSVDCIEACDPEDCFSRLEGEPVCGTDYVDTYNGGCNSVPPVFQRTPCFSLHTVCGQGGNYLFEGANYRDTDWYEMFICCNGDHCVTMCADFESQLAIVDGDIGCDAITFVCGSVFGAPGTSVTCCVSATAGQTLWVFAATSAFSGVPCGSRYWLEITRPCTADATDNTSWGRVKGLFT